MSKNLRTISHRRSLETFDMLTVVSEDKSATIDTVERIQEVLMRFECSLVG